VGAKITLFRRVVFGIDEDRVVRAGCDASFAANTNGFVEVDDAVRPLMHGGGRTRRHARGILALVAAGNLKRPPPVGKDTHVDVFDVRPGDGERDFVF